jgi:3-hydroxymyristoyl/3-hydroxydecanoyl-(acyl carrier protein) dehydratase
MPGVLIGEAMAQTGGVLLLQQPENRGKLVYFMSMDGVKFRRPVVPGDQLRMVVTVVQNRGKTVKLRGEAFVDGQLATEADMMARIADA